MKKFLCVCCVLVVVGLAAVEAQELKGLSFSKCEKLVYIYPHAPPDSKDYTSKDYTEDMSSFLFGNWVYDLDNDGKEVAQGVLQIAFRNGPIKQVSFMFFNTEISDPKKRVFQIISHSVQYEVSYDGKKSEVINPEAYATIVSDGNSTAIFIVKDKKDGKPVMVLSLKP